MHRTPFGVLVLIRLPTADNQIGIMLESRHLTPSVVFVIIAELRFYFNVLGYAALILSSR